MKRTTYIMFTLIIGGVVLVASMFTLIRFTAERCDDTWRYGPEIIAGQVDTVQLPVFDVLDINYGYNAGEGEDMSVYVRNGMPVRILADSTASNPYVLVPETFYDVDMDDSDGVLHMRFIFSKRYCEYNDSVSSPITIAVPVSMAKDLSRVKCGDDVTTHLMIEYLNGKNIDFPLCDNVYLYLNHCRFDSVGVKGNDYINVYGTKIGCMSVTGKDDCKIIYTDGTDVGETYLSGENTEYRLVGVGNYEARPNPGSEITVTKVYKD